MLEHCQNASERWGGVNQLIDRWLEGRKALAGAYIGLLDDAQPVAVTEKGLQAFCQLLLDYLSGGHFELYENLIAEGNAFGDTRAVELGGQLFPRLKAITEAALAFNDRYDNGDSRDNLTFSTELKTLGALLSERFELEDCLIDVLHKAHQQQAQALV